jgi:hypothetical protein
MQPPLYGTGAKELYRDSADVVLALDQKRIVVVSSEAMQDSSTPEGYTMIAAALIDITKRGKAAAPGAALPQRVRSRGERIGVARFGNRLSIAEVGQSRPFGFSYDFQKNRIAPLTKKEFDPPVAKGTMPVVPKLYDFRTKSAFYDFVTKSEIPACMWTEWDARCRKWRRFRIPPGEPGSVFYFRGNLYAQAWDAKNVIRLYRASASRNSWRALGPYKVIARNVSETAWLVQRTTDGKVYLARF